MQNPKQLRQGQLQLGFAKTGKTFNNAAAVVDMQWTRSTLRSWKQMELHAGERLVLCWNTLVVVSRGWVASVRWVGVMRGRDRDEWVEKKTEMAGEVGGWTTTNVSRYVPRKSLLGILTSSSLLSVAMDKSERQGQEEETAWFSASLLTNTNRWSAEFPNEELHYSPYWTT